MAALDLAAGVVLGCVRAPHRSVEFIEYVQLLEAVSCEVVAQRAKTAGLPLRLQLRGRPSPDPFVHHVAGHCCARCGLRSPEAGSDRPASPHPYRPAGRTGDGASTTRHLAVCALEPDALVTVAGMAERERVVRVRGTQIYHTLYRLALRRAGAGVADGSGGQGGI